MGMVNKKLIILFKVIISLFTIFFIVLYFKDLINVFNGNLDYRLFSPNSSAEPFIYTSKFVYIFYEIIQIILLILQQIIIFFKKIKIKYLLILININLLLIILPLIITK